MNFPKKGNSNHASKEIDSFARKMVTFIPLLFLILSAIMLFKAISNHKFNSGKDDVSKFEETIFSLKKSLPSRGFVGYFNDVEPESIYGGDFWMTQYALAPLIVGKNIDSDFIVGILHPSQTKKNSFEKVGFSVVRDYGNGIVLLQRGNR